MFPNKKKRTVNFKMHLKFQIANSLKRLEKKILKKEVKIVKSE